MDIDKVRRITDKYDRSPVECDGMTRVLHTVLLQNNIPHNVYVGWVEFKKESFSPHYWIRLADSSVVDYRLRMWFGDDAPHGIFNAKDFPVKYHGSKSAMTELPDHLFRILTDRMDWGSAFQKLGRS